MSTILIIDDNQLILEFLRRVFDEEGFDVRIACDGREGIVVAREAAPQAVVLDLKLPGMSGKKVLKKLKSLAPTLPVFVFSSHFKRNGRLDELGGADGCFPKEKGIEPLLAAVKSVARPSR